MPWTVTATFMNQRCHIALALGLYCSLFEAWKVANSLKNIKFDQRELTVITNEGRSLPVESMHWIAVDLDPEGHQTENQRTVDAEIVDIKTLKVLHKKDPIRLESVDARHRWCSKDELVAILSSSQGNSHDNDLCIGLSVNQHTDRPDSICLITTPLLTIADEINLLIKYYSTDKSNPLVTYIRAWIFKSNMWFDGGLIYGSAIDIAIDDDVMETIQRFLIEARPNIEKNDRRPAP